MANQQNPRVTAQYEELLAGIRACKPKCVECECKLDREITGIRTRLADNGSVEKVCRSCFFGEIAEQLMGVATA